MIQGLCYGDLAGEIVICASKGGRDEHPAWYLNILAAKTVDVQIATEAFRATWREPAGAERDKVWAFMEENFPFYAQYKVATARTIPLVMLKPVERIGVFRESDLD